MALELFTSKTCGYCAEMREQLEWDGVEFVEYDVDADPAARARLGALAGGTALLPTLVEDGRISRSGVGGRGCYVGGG